MNVEQKRQRLDDLLARPLGDDAREEVRELLDGVREHEQFILREDGYEEFLLSFVKRYDGEACDCRNYGCPLKQGRVPRRVINVRDGWRREVRRYAHEHRGSAAALVKAQDEYAAKVRELEQVYNEAIATAREDLREGDDPLSRSDTA